MKIKSISLVVILSLLSFTNVANAWFGDAEREAKCKKKEVAENNALSQVKISDWGLGTDESSRNGNPYIYGRFFNNSSYPIDRIYFFVTFKDCYNNVCTIIGEHMFTIESLVPSGQARDFTSLKESIFDGNTFPQLRTRGKLQITGQLRSLKIENKQGTDLYCEQY